MTLNLIGVAYHMGFWFGGETWHSVYHILQASRLMLLWSMFHMVNPTSVGARARWKQRKTAVNRVREGEEKGRQVNG